MLKWYIVKGTFHIEPEFLIEAESEKDAMLAVSELLVNAEVDYDLDGNQKLVEEVSVLITATSAVENKE